MKFNEYIDKYKKGTLTQEEAELVETEIEKYKAIRGYICEENKERYFNRKSTRNIVISLVIIIALIGISTIWINWCFYNPNKGYKSEYGTGQFFIDTSVFTELHSPGYYTNWVKAKEKGIGRYDIAIRQWSGIDKKQKTYKNEIVRGKITDTADIHEFWNFPASNAFGGRNSNVSWQRDGDVYSTQPPDERKYQVDELRNVPSYSSVSAYFGFKKDITLKEFEKMYKDSEGLSFSYVAVGIEKEGTEQNVLGFEPTGTGPVIKKGLISEENYPYFEISNHRDELEKNSVKVWESHFKTLLKYMSTREEFLSTMADVNNINTNLYKNALSYVNKNGVNIYGVLVNGSAKDILAFEQQNNIVGIMVNDIKLSSLSR